MGFSPLGAHIDLKTQVTTSLLDESTYRENYAKKMQPYWTAILQVAQKAIVGYNIAMQSGCHISS